MDRAVVRRFVLPASFLVVLKVLYVGLQVEFIDQLQP